RVAVPRGLGQVVDHVLHDLLGGLEAERRGVADVELDDPVAFLLHQLGAGQDRTANVVTDAGELGRLEDGRGRRMAVRPGTGGHGGAFSLHASRPIGSGAPCIGRSSGLPSLAADPLASIPPVQRARRVGMMACLIAAAGLGSGCPWRAGQPPPPTDVPEIIARTVPAPRTPFRPDAHLPPGATPLPLRP